MCNISLDRGFVFRGRQNQSIMDKFKTVLSHPTKEPTTLVKMKRKSRSSLFPVRWSDYLLVHCLLLLPTVKVPNGASRASPRCVSRIHFDIIENLRPGVHTDIAERYRRGHSRVHGSFFTSRLVSTPPPLPRCLYESQRLNPGMRVAVDSIFPSI